MGLGAALAVAIGATRAQPMLLTALMRILGPVDWYSPRILTRQSGALVPARGRTRSSTRPPAPPTAGRAGARHQPSVSPSRAVPAQPRDAMAVTRYCDHDHPAIHACLAELAHGARGGDQTRIAMAAFEFVRDSVIYGFGPWGMPASSTLQQRKGMCTNKANLLVALLRAAGIPAAYGVIRVDPRRYFGVVGPRFLTRYASRESVHIHGAAFLNERWVKCDPSTDRELASRTAHFCMQTRLVEWDGLHDSLDILDPRHVYADLGLYADIDELLSRPARQFTPRLMALGNDYLAFIRGQPPFPSDEALVRAYQSVRHARGSVRRAHARPARQLVRK